VISLQKEKLIFQQKASTINLSLDLSNRDKNDKTAILDEMEKVIGMFELDRLAYNNKIKELLEHIVLSEKRECEKDEMIHELELSLKIVQEQMVIMKKTLKMKN
jgi:hypothetical protein